MTATGLRIGELLDEIESHVARLGVVDRVGRHEPKDAPAVGITAAVWVQRVRPMATVSGLNTTAAVLELTMRFYQQFIAEPQDHIDPAMVDAVDRVIAELSGDFTLGGAAMFVDLLGQSGTSLEANAGYLTIGQTMYRVYDLTIPLVLDHAWTQGGTP